MDLRGLVTTLVSLINTIIPVLSSLVVLFFLWVGVRYVYRSGGSEGHSQDRQQLIWGLIALFVLFSIWGILALLQNALGLPTSTRSAPAPTPPASLPATISV